MTLALGLLLMQAGHAQAVTGPPVAVKSDMLLLEVVVDKQTVSDGVTAYQSEHDILLPLGELARLLTLAITTQPERGTASGYILQEDRTFSLDLASAVVVVDGKREVVDLQLIDVRPDDIYVSSRLLARWLPVDLDVDLSRLSLDVGAREQLPLQLRLEREAQAARFGARPEAIAPKYPRYELPYRLLGWPFVDQTLSVDYRGGNGRGDVESRYSAYVAADLLGMQGTLYVNAGPGNESTDARLTLGRNDPDAGLLGPLRARTAVVGNFPVPAVMNISRTSALGNGILLSNRPLSQPTSFGQHSLSGPLPPGWDVELYFNDVLIGFQASGPDGQYRFDDQPLVFGPNEFRLVFHGPLGQARVEKETFLLEQSATPTGEFYYSIAQQNDDEGQTRAVAQFDWGLSEHLTATAGIVRVPVARKTQSYVHLGLQSYLGAMILSGEMAKSRYGSLAQLALRTRIGKWAVSASHAQLDDFTSELFLPSSDAVRSNTQVRVAGSLALPSSLIRLPMTIEASREQRGSGASKLDVAGRISAHVRGTSITGQYHWHSLAGEKLADTTLEVSHRVGRVGFRSQIHYAIAPESRLTAVTLSADRRWEKGYLQSFGMTRFFGSSDTLYTAGLTKSLGRFGLGVNVGYSSNGDISAGVQLFLAMGREPRRRGWLLDAQPMASTGGVSALVFLDDDMNGRMDPGELPIENVGFTVNGGKHPVTTGVDGIAYLARLPVVRPTDIAVVPETLEDPQWLPRISGVRVVPRPGAVAMLEFPVVMTSEIDGTVYVAEDDRRREMGALVIEVVDGTGTIIATSKSASDGYYVLAGVPAGEYLVRASPAQMGRLGLRDAATHPVTVSSDGRFVSGIDIEVQANL